MVRLRVPYSCTRSPGEFQEAWGYKVLDVGRTTFVACGNPAQTACLQRERTDTTDGALGSTRVEVESIPTNSM